MPTARDLDPSPSAAPPSSDAPPEESKPKARKRTRASPVLLGVDELVAEGVSREVAASWLEIRKAKRLPLTVVAWAEIKGQAEKARLTLEASLRAAVSNGWAGFKAKWLENDGSRDGSGASVFSGVQGRDFI